MSSYAHGIANRGGDYPSISMFIDRGFRVLPAGWKNLEATMGLIEFTRLHADPKLLGHMFTTWGVERDALVDFPPLVEGLKFLRDECPPHKENIDLATAAA